MRDEAGLFLDEGYIFGREGAGFERMVLACPLPPIGAGPGAVGPGGRPAGPAPVRPPVPPGRAHSTRNTGSSSAFWAPPFLLFLSAGPPPPLW